MVNEKKETTVGICGNENEVTQLKKTIATLKRKITLLEKDVQRYKTLDKEGDELNEKRIGEIEELKAEINTLRSRIVHYEERITQQAQDIAKQSLKIKELNGDLAMALANKEHEKAIPWYRKIFSR